MSSEELPDSESESEPNILIELIELDKFALSFDMVHKAADGLLGESSTVFPKPLLCGICIPLPAIGDASGDISANVE